MIGTLVAGALSAIGQGVATAVGQKKARKQAEEARRILDNQARELDEWYASRSAKDYTRRADANRLIAKQREILEEQYKNAAATNVVAGGSDNALALQKEAANKAMAETTADVTNATLNAEAELREQTEEQYMNQKRVLEGQVIANKQAQAENISAATGQAATAIGNAGGVIGESVDDLIANKKKKV